ncbi:beta-carotene hydroxylase 2, chloroplastic-like [Senna tora]|uniref:beta-carotene 3-hydroxylase n=1 Tax=Senna tora TaxID=362788 RepID=A0A834THX2_9FABA|nr:beta-carotene hydroxylase 2, chloroplastic-like [Senna tora]
MPPVNYNTYERRTCQAIWGIRVRDTNRRRQKKTTSLSRTSKLAASMAAGLSAAITSKPLRLHQTSLDPLPKAAPTTTTLLSTTPSRGLRRDGAIVHRRRTRRMTTSFTACVLMEDPKRSVQIESDDDAEKVPNCPLDSEPISARMAERLARKRSERFTYLVAAVMSSFGVTSMAILAVYYRFSWQMEGGEVPWSEMFGTFALSVGAAVGMEFWARWAHRALWHASLWHMHESHHRAREGPFELNDVFAIINAVPAIALLSYGFFHKGLVPGLCFGALHHTDKFNGVPYGLFMGPKEIGKVGGTEELEKEITLLPVQISAALNPLLNKLR